MSWVDGERLLDPISGLSLILGANALETLEFGGIEGEDQIWSVLVTWKPASTLQHVTVTSLLLLFWVTVLLCSPDLELGI